MTFHSLLMVLYLLIALIEASEFELTAEGWAHLLVAFAYVVLALSCAKQQ